KTVTLVDLVGIGDVGMEGIELYPNPTSGSITIKAGRGAVSSASVTLKLYDSIGKEILRKTVEAIEMEQGISIDLNAHNEGVYFISIETENGIRVLKVLKN